MSFRDNNPPLVSVLIVNFNGEQILERCINCVLASNYSNIEVIIVDNASSDNSVDLLANQFGQIKVVVNDENIGFAGGNNIGIKHCDGDFILLLNTDAFIEENTIGHLVEFLSKDVKRGVAQPELILDDNRSSYDSCGCHLTNFWLLSHYGLQKSSVNGEYTEPITLFSVKGACMMIKSDVIKKVGLFSDGFWCYYEETDFCHRAWLLGFEIWYAPGARCYHMVGKTSNSFPRPEIHYHNFKNKLYSIICNLSLLNALKATFYTLVFGFAFATACTKVHGFSMFRCKAQAISWLFRNRNRIFKQRALIQKNRVISDIRLLERTYKPEGFFYPFRLLLGFLSHRS